MDTSQGNDRAMDERHYDVQLGKLQVSVEGLKSNFEDFKEEQRRHNSTVIDALDNKINGKLTANANQLSEHKSAIATLISEVEHLKRPPLQIPMPQPGTRATVEVTDAEAKPITRRDLQVAVTVTVTLLTIIGLIVKYWPVADAASKAVQ